MNTKDKIYKVMHKCLLCMLALFTSFSALTSVPIKAAGYTPTIVGVIKGAGAQVTQGYNMAYWRDGIEKIQVEGQYAFCIEPTTIGKGGTYSKNDDIPADLRLKLSRIAYYGWDTTNKSDDDYATTQYMIWEALGATINQWYGSFGSRYPSLKANVQAKINNHTITPSFPSGNHSVDVGDTLTLPDSRGVLNSFHVKDGGGATVSISGNDLKITPSADSPEQLKIVLQKELESFVGSSIAYRSSADDGQDVGVFKVKDPFKINVNITVNKFGEIKIAKQDEDGTMIPNTKFTLSLNADMSDPIGTYTTGADGTVTIKELRPQTIYIQEVSVPANLILDSTIKSIIVKANETSMYTATNNWIKGYIQVVKKDIDSGKDIIASDATFSIYKGDNSYVRDIKTNKNGIAISDLSRYGDYYLIEKIAPDKYTHSNQRIVYQVREDGFTYSAEFSNKRTLGSIKIKKEDSLTGKQPQGEATLEKAKYGLYAKNNILDPADNSIKYTKDTKISELITDKEAEASIHNLYLGDYYLKEIEPSHGYTLDTTVYPITLTYDNQDEEVVTKTQTVIERVVSQAFSIIKVSDNGSGETDLLEGAEFTIKAQKEIEKAGSWEKAPIAKNARGDVSSILRTDKKGYALSDELPFGTYVIRETKVPDDHYAVPDFTVVVDKDSRDPQPWRVFNDEKFKAIIAIVKKDLETGKTIALEGAEFKIKNNDTNKYVGQWVWNPLPHYVDSWTTDETGQVMTDDLLDPGNYQLEEIKAPEGYLLDETPIKFIVSSNTVYETLPDGTTPVITMIKENKSVKGQITVEKQGEVLIDAKKDEHGNYSFSYETRKIPDAVFEIYAKDNIYSADNQKDLLYSKGQLIETLTTGKNGTATSKRLPLATYLVKEKTAPDGMVINKEEKEVSLEYKDQNTPLVFVGTSMTNKRQKVNLAVIKKDSETKIGLLGAEFTLYAKEDVSNSDGKIIIKKDEPIEMATSNKDGIAKFKADLPLIKAYIKETKAPIGYASSDEIINIDASYQGQEIALIKVNETFENDIIQVEVSKKDITTGKELSGAQMSVIDSNMQMFDTWVSSNEPHIIKGLEINKTYTLKELSSPYGFSLAQEVKFTVTDTGKMQKVVMKNDLVRGNLAFEKIGEAFNATVIGQSEFGKEETPIWNEQNLLNAQITIYAAEDITLGNAITYWHKDEAIQTLESDWETVVSKNLLVGRYYYMETSPLHGYVTNTEKHYFEIKDSQSSNIQVVKSQLENKRPSVDVKFTKKMELLKVQEELMAWKDVVFGIYAREDIYGYMGNVVIEHGTLIGTTGIDELGQLDHTPDFPNGTYYIKELKTNKMYNLDTNEYNFEIVWHGGDVSNYTILIGNDDGIMNELQRGSISIHKTDKDTRKALAGVKFSMAKDKEFNEIIKEVVSDKDGIALFDELELGTYFIKESAVSGYVTNNHIYEVEVKKDGDDLMIEIENKPIEVEFSKLDFTTSKELPGAKMQLIDKESGMIIEEWISTTETHKIKYLVEGKEYELKEIFAPSGYDIAESIVFKAADGIKIVMIDKHTPKAEETPETGDMSNVEVYTMIALISLGLLALLLMKKKRSE